MKITIQEEPNLQDGGYETKASGDTNNKNVKDKNCYYPYWNQSASKTDQKMSKLKTKDHSEHYKRIPTVHILKNSVNNKLVIKIC